MAGLPVARSLLLHATVALVRERCACTLAEARNALLQAFSEGTIITRALAQTTWPGRSEGMPDDIFPVEMYPDAWLNLAVDWEGDRLGDYWSVSVERSSIDRWLPDDLKAPHGPCAAATLRGYQATDAPLLEKMQRLLLSGEAQNVWKAAEAVSRDAQGSKLADAATKRLAKKYKGKYG